MTVEDHKNSLLTDISKTLDTLDRVKSLFSKLDDMSFEDENEDEGEASFVLRKVLDLCEEAGKYLNSSQQHCEVIINILGDIFSPTLKSSSQGSSVNNLSSSIMLGEDRLNYEKSAGDTSNLDTNDAFQELDDYRQQLGLPIAGSENDRTTVAKLEIGGIGFFGISSGSNPNRRRITLTVNPISRTHAEADALQQAFDAGVRGGRARLVVDRDLCRACGQNGGVKGMARQLDLEVLEVISPSGCEIIQLK